MNKNLPAEYNFNIFTKFCNFFRKIFSRKLKEDSNNITEINEVSNLEVKSELRKSTNDISADYIRDMNKEQFIRQLEENPKLLNSLTIEQLEKLDSYYDDIISEYEEKLKRIS